MSCCTQIFIVRGKNIFLHSAIDYTGNFHEMSKKHEINYIFCVSRFGWHKNENGHYNI